MTFNAYKKQIFIAEDDPVTRLLLDAAVQKWNFEPTSTDNGADALQILEKLEHPYVIILDWQMPGMNGIDIVRALRGNRKDVPHYIIMLTSRNERDDIVSALDAGADDFISKPFDPEELRARINSGTRLISMHTQLSQALQNAHRLTDFIANYDQTTGLPNRQFFTDKIKELINNGRPGGLMLINIDRFKIINQTKGLDVGDMFLNYFGVRLQECFDIECVIARIAADEFGILLQNISEKSEPDEVVNMVTASAHRVHSCVQEEFPVADGINITVSIGAVIVSHQFADTPEEFLRRADTALRRAKSLGGNQTVMHDLKMEEEIRQRYTLERELRAALSGDELQLYLQAQVDSNRNFVGAEALIRWEHPEKGFLSPALFIPLAEETDLIIEIDRWVLDKVCALIKKFQNSTFSISVNISPKHFASEHFVNDVLSSIDKWKIPGHRLVLEITEGLLIKEIETVISKMTRLASEGIRFSIDDFGTGYSSLSYLKQLPISEIKIDRAFIKGLPDDENSAAIVKAIFLMARAFGLEVVAEGVETDKQAITLDSIGTLLHQGFLFSKPLPAEETLAYWISK